MYATVIVNDGSTENNRLSLTFPICGDINTYLNLSAVKQI